MNITIYQGRIGYRIPVNGVIYNPTTKDWPSTGKPCKPSNNAFATYGEQRMDSEFNARYGNFERRYTI